MQSLVMTGLVVVTTHMPLVNHPDALCMHQPNPLPSLLPPLEPLHSRQEQDPKPHSCQQLGKGELATLKASCPLLPTKLPLMVVTVE